MEQKFMQKAIELAYDNVRKRGEPYGAVVVRNGEIVGTGANDVQATNDPTAHAEVQAIREACQRLNTTDLSDCDMYASGEPCPMCMAAIYWTRFKTVYYAYPKSPAEDELGAAYIYKELSLPIDQRSVPMKQVENNDPNKDPFALWNRMNE